MGVARSLFHFPSLQLPSPDDKGKSPVTPYQVSRSFSLSFRGTSGIDIDLRRVDINQCKSSKAQESKGQFNIFGGTDKCKTKTTTVSEGDILNSLSIECEGQV